jgi:hypothetical protein
LNCADKDRLLAEFNRSVKEWSKAVYALSNQVGAGRGTYLTLLGDANQAQVKTKEAKTAYDKHIAQHGC